MIDFVLLKSGRKNAYKIAFACRIVIQLEHHSQPFFAAADDAVVDGLNLFFHMCVTRPRCRRHQRVSSTTASVINRTTYGIDHHEQNNNFSLALLTFYIKSILRLAPHQSYVILRINDQLLNDQPTPLVSHISCLHISTIVICQLFTRV